LFPNNETRGHLGKSGHILIEQEPVITLPSKRQSLPFTMLCCAAVIYSSTEVYTRLLFCCEEPASPAAARDAQGFTSKPSLCSSAGFGAATPRRAVRRPQGRKIQKINGGGGASPQPPWGINCGVNSNQCARWSHSVQKRVLSTMRTAAKRATSTFMRAHGPVRAARLPPSDANSRAASSFAAISPGKRPSPCRPTCRCRRGRARALAFEHRHLLSPTVDGRTAHSALPGEHALLGEAFSGGKKQLEDHTFL